MHVRVRSQEVGTLQKGPQPNLAGSKGPRSTCSVRPLPVAISSAMASPVPGPSSIPQQECPAAT